ncbi:MAG: carboxypeptidase-like regulatory domain-containing protein [Saprospiraceae bacterium]|nr:carboxypeptidase-like regulatory domain-containing protein [Saprospiraceae bacterium]
MALLVRILALLWCSGALLAPAQVVVSGTVRDTAGVAVPMASVVLSACADERTLAYGYADVEGHYRLSFAVPEGCDTLSLTVRGIGFQAQTLLIALRDLRPHYDIALVNAQLQEVVVRARYTPVVQRGDTTEYRLRSFSDSTEFSVEDLLKKLPGFQVNEQGMISVNGRTVSSVLLEGDDLFGYNYALATRNLRADAFETVQVIERYQENPLLKGIADSERLALNLTLREDRKYAWSGHAAAGLGVGGGARAYSHLNLFSVSKREKIYLFGKADNAGQTSLHDASALIPYDPFNPRLHLRQGAPQMRSLQQEPTENTMGMPRAFVLQNRTALGCYGHVLPVGALKLKISAWGGGERTAQQAFSESRFLLGSSDLNLSETATTQWQRQVYHAEAEGNYYSPNARRSFRFFARADHAPVRYEQDIARQQAGADVFRIQADGNRLPLDLFLSTEYTHKVGKNSLLQLTGRQDYLRHRYDLQGEHAYYPLFFGLAEDFRRLEQQAAQVQRRTQLSALFMAARGSIQWQTEIGAYWHDSRLSSAFSLHNTQAKRWQPAPGEPYAGAFRVRVQRYYARAEGVYHHNRWRFSAQLLGGWQPIALIEERTTPRRQALPLLQPGAQASYKITDRSAFHAQYGFQQQMPAVASLYPGYRFSSALQLLNGLPDPSWIARHHARISYAYNDLVRRMTTASLSASITHADRELGAQHLVNPFLSINEPFRPVTFTSYALAGNAGRYFSALSSRLDVNILYDVSDQQMRVNSDALRQVRTRHWQAGVGYGSAFEGWVNVFLRVNALRSVSDNQLSARETAAAVSQNWLSSAELVFKPSALFRLKWRAQHVAFRSSASPYAHLWAVNGEAFFQLPRQHSELRLLWNNLLATRRFESAFADGFAESRSGVAVAPRFALLTWSFKF